MNILAVLQDRFRTAISQLVDEEAVAELAAMIRPAQDARFGDYQANCAMPLGKRLQQPPREVAQKLVDIVQIEDLCLPPEVAGPGFINLTLRDDWLAEWLLSICDDDRLGIAATLNPRTYIVDFSSPNVAKPMHVGHIRSTVIGDSLCRTLRFLGHTVISDNHLGDWGTQFGMIIYGYRHFADPVTYDQGPVAELTRVYRIVRQLVDFHAGQATLPKEQAKHRDLEHRLADALAQPDSPNPKDAAKQKKLVQKLRDDTQRQAEAIAELQAKLATILDDPAAKKLADEHARIGEAVLEETAKLHAGDAENLKLWEKFVPQCRDEIDTIYHRLDITFDEELGESYYHDRLAGVVDQLSAKGLAKESEGAVCVFLDGYDAPMIIRKRDGAYLYATTDLATIEYRMKRWRPDAILYVVDFRQGEHFAKLFAAARAWGYDQVELTHVSFGTVLGPDGKPFKTRSGETVSLESLLDEAVDRAEQVVSDNDAAKRNGPELDVAQREHVAHVVGHAAIKYADLSQNRTSDYVFQVDKMVAMQGNTATYLQYSYARIQNIFSKGEIDIMGLRRNAVTLDFSEPQERGIAIALLQWAEAIEECAADYRPHVLANYLFALAKRFAEFYEACPVLKAEELQVRNRRLLLCDLVGRTLKLGLSLLGLQVVDKM